MEARALPLLATFFQRVQVLVWSRFKAIMEAHVQSLAAYAPPKGAAAEVHPHFVARRRAAAGGEGRLPCLSAAPICPPGGSRGPARSH